MLFSTMPVSATGWLITRFTIDRNNHLQRDCSGSERYWAQFAYIAVLPFAFLETVIIRAFSWVAYCGGDALRHEYRCLDKWAKKSAYALLWTIDCIFMNLCSKRLYSELGDYFNFITHFSWQTFRDRFSQIDWQPTPFDEPSSLERKSPLVSPESEAKQAEAVKEILKNYEIAEGAKQCSVLFESLYSMIDKPSEEQISSLPDEIHHLMSDWENHVKIDKDLRSIAENSWTPLNERFCRMLIFTKNVVIASNNPDQIVNFKNQFAGVFRACVNRTTTEMERIFFEFAAPALFEKIRTKLSSRSRDLDDSFLKLIYKMIPDPTEEEIQALISYLTSKIQPGVGDTLIAFLIGKFTNLNQPLPAAHQDFIKMLVYTQRALLNHHDETLRAINETAFIETLLTFDIQETSLDKEKNETLFFQYGAAELLEKAYRERLLYEFTNIRRKKSDYIIQRIVVPPHDLASTLNYVAAEHHKDFYLPPPPLSQVDLVYRNAAHKRSIGPSIAAFRKHYLSPITLYAELQEIVWPVDPDNKPVRTFTKDDFSDYLKEKYYRKAKQEGTLPESIKSPKDFGLPEEVLREDALGYQPQVLVDFLEEMRFIKKKSGREVQRPVTPPPELPEEERTCFFLPSFTNPILSAFGYGLLAFFTQPLLTFSSGALFGLTSWSSNRLLNWIFTKADIDQNNIIANIAKFALRLFTHAAFGMLALTAVGIPFSFGATLFFSANAYLIGPKITFYISYFSLALANFVGVEFEEEIPGI